MLREKRKSPRRSILFNAWVGLGGGSPLRGCVVSDLSETGAKLQLANPEELPETFNLLLSGRGRIHRRCRAVWRKQNQMGVHFEQAEAEVRSGKPAKRVTEPAGAA